MSIYSYEIILINEGRDKDYNDFWNNGVEVNDAGEVLHPALVGFTEIIDAKNLNEAISIAEKKFPNNKIARDDCCKIG